MEATITLASVERKDGTSKAGKAYTKFTIHGQDGTKYATFDAGLAELARTNTGKTARVQFDSGQFGNDLKGIVVTNDTPVPQAPPAKTPTGEADWDLIGLRKTRCALWAAAIQANHSIAEARALVMAAESDIFHRAPATGVDSDIPFMWLEAAPDHGVHHDPWRRP